MGNLIAQGAGQAVGQALGGNNNTINLQPGKGIANGVQGITIGQLVGAGINFILVIAALIFFVMLVVGGVRWILSGGDKGQTEAARSQITAALIGLVIVFAAWAIASLIGSLFGVSIFNLNFISVNQF